MKKLIAISLLAIHLFNLAGYSLVSAWLIQRSDAQFISHLDKGNYNESALVEVKIALHLPYMQSSAGYERVNGSVEHDGVQYNYVKRRVCNDTLSVLCIPNEDKSSIVKETRHLGKELNDFPGERKNKNTGVKKSVLSSDFETQSILSSIERLQASQHPPGAGLSQSLLPAFTSIPEHPPCITA